MQEDTPQLMRTRSDVGVRRRGNVRTSSDQRRIRRHRFSINGHFYNHKVEEKPRGHHYFLGICCFSAYGHVVVGGGGGRGTQEAKKFWFSLKTMSVMEAFAGSLRDSGLPGEE